MPSSVIVGSRPPRSCFIFSYSSRVRPCCRMVSGGKAEVKEVAMGRASIVAFDGAAWVGRSQTPVMNFLVRTALKSAFANDQRPMDASSGYLVLTLYQAAGIVLCRDVTELQIARQCAKERNPFANQHRHTSDGETLHQAGAQKPLNRDPTVHVHMLHATGGQPRDDLRRSAGHLLHNAATNRRE